MNHSNERQPPDLGQCIKNAAYILICMFHLVGIKKWNQSKTFHLAFLNGDDDREIEWVQKASKMIEAKFEIKCAIPGKDFLYGFPLKKKLCMQFELLSAVITTVTNNNYKQFAHFIDQNTNKPLVCVELDYVMRVPEELWQRPYINCTTCEHLWFPRLIDTLETELPGA